MWAHFGADMLRDFNGAEVHRYHPLGPIERQVQYINMFATYDESWMLDYY